MSEQSNILTLSLPASARAAKITQAAASDPVAAWNGAAGNYGKAAKTWAAAYVESGRVAEDLDLGRTVVAALMVKALDAEAAAKKKGDIASLTTISAALEESGSAPLPKGSALPGQWRNVARMVTDLGMSPTEPITRWLTSNKPTGLPKAVREAKSAQDVIAFAESLGVDKMSDRKRAELGFAPRPAAAVTTGGDAPNTADNTSQSGTNATTDTRGSGTPQSTSVKVGDLSPEKRVILLEQILSSLQPKDLTDEAKATLAAHCERLTA